MSSLIEFEQKAKLSASETINYTRPYSFAESEKRILQAVSTDEMLTVLALCAGFNVNPHRKIQDIIKDYNMALKVKSVLECANASACSTLEAHMALSHIPGDVLFKVFPKALPYYNKNNLAKKARKELIKNGMCVRNVITEDLNEIKNLEKMIEKCNTEIKASVSTNTIESILFSEVKNFIDKEYKKFDMFNKNEVEIYIFKQKILDKLYQAYKKNFFTTRGMFEDCPKFLDKYFNVFMQLKEYENNISVIKQKCYKKVINVLIEISLINEEEAQHWAEQNTTISAAVYKQLKRQGYPINDFKKHCAEFYRLVGGKLGKVIFSRDKNDDRSHCKSENEVITNGYIDKETLFHELSHALEFSSSQFASCSKNFVLSRAASKAAKKLSELTKNFNYKDYEVAYEDHFFNPYVGKWYNDNISEVLSMGIQQLTSPELLYEIITKDPEHLDYTLSVCIAKEQFGSKNLEFSDDEKENITEEGNKKKLIDHFDNEIIRIGIAYKLRPIPAKYIFSHDIILIENHLIVETNYEQIKQYAIYEKRRTKGFAKRTDSAADLSIAQLALYLFAVRNQIDKLQKDGIKNIFQVAKSFILYGEVPNWFTESTTLPEFNYE